MKVIKPGKKYAIRRLKGKYQLIEIIKEYPDITQAKNALVELLIKK
jgi:hypothetical protein